jgi:hypothetical protein
MDHVDLQERYLIVSHNQTEHPFRIVGSAYKKPDESHFRIYFRLFPGVRYYLAPNRDRDWEYLLFSGGETQSDGSMRFFCKIGSGVYLSKTNTVEIHVPDLRQVYYLKLEPEDYHAQKTAA